MGYGQVILGVAMGRVGSGHGWHGHLPFPNLTHLLLLVLETHLLLSWVPQCKPNLKAKTNHLKTKLTIQLVQVDRLSCSESGWIGKR